MNCQTQKTNASNNNSSSNQDTTVKKIDLKEGEYTQIPKTSLNAKYIGVIEDSRCPEGATCVWAGLAIIELEVMTPTSRPQIIQLSTMDFEGKNAKKTESIYGYNITLEKVSSKRKKDGSLNTDKGDITISVEKTD